MPLRLFGGQKKSCQKKSFGEKYDRKSGYEAWPKLYAVSSPSYITRLDSSNKINVKTEKKLGISQRSTVVSEGLDEYHVLYSPLNTTASLPMMLGSKAQALSYHVPTKYLFLPNSQAQSLEIPF